ILACGISDYDDPRNRLHFPAPDADLITTTFKKLENNGFINAVHVRKYQNRQASKKGIEEGLTWLAEKMEPKDIGIFFFCGHGGKDPTGDFYLIPVEFDGNYAGSGVTGRFVSEKLADMQGRLICMLDACHSGASAEIKPVVTGDLVSKLAGTDCG